MLIRMTTPMEGPGVSRHRGQEVEVSDREAARLIQAGYAVPVREAAEPEKAVMRRTRKPRKT